MSSIKNKHIPKNKDSTNHGPNGPQLSIYKEIIVVTYDVMICNKRKVC